MTKNLSYLSYPLPPDIQRLFEAGDFDRMARVIRQRLEDPRVPKTLHERLRFQLIIAKEIPEYYRLTQADMLAGREGDDGVVAVVVRRNIIQ